ncbi:MAG: hypothetical protein HUK20_08015, partial [Fibrobacter sp.]|nr:hypothetical protein [Fibrobacter sp.]
MNLKKVLFAVIGLSAVCSFAIPPKTWDAIYNAEGEGDYTSGKIEGNIRFGKYTHYKEVQPVSFRVKDGLFQFSVAGTLTVPAEALPILQKFDEAFYSEFFIVAKVSFEAGEDGDFACAVAKTDLPRCPRCWNHL